MWSWGENLIRWVSAERLLDNHPNGGMVIAFRTAHAATLLYLVTLAARELLAPSADWGICSISAKAVRDTLPWYGAAIAGVYAGLYSRFSSQWTYLANLYNQIMASAVQQPELTGGSAADAFAAWRAGFIEDAEDLHLATKPMFAVVILSFLTFDGVRDAYAKNTVGGQDRLAVLEKQCEAVIAAKTRNWYKSHSRVPR